MKRADQLRVSRRLVLGGAAGLGARGSFAHAQGRSGGEVFIGPLAGWLNVKSRFGAVGDGAADDTAALQKALAALHDDGGSASALWLPAGRYRITRTLTLPRKVGREAIGLNIQGEDPDRTAIIWDGPAGGTMFDYGAWYSKIGRLTLDGAGRAGIALAHGPEFVTANEITDMVFKDVAVGIEAGTMQTSGIAETSVQRCRFVRCSSAGASIRNFNTLDWWFWHCRFEDCGLGLTNVFGAGNFHAYSCLFQRSKVADISMHHTGFLSFRGNTSIGSRAFFQADVIDAAAELTFQNNTIIDTTDAAAIQIGNFGPVLLIDNVIAARPGAQGPLVVAPRATGAAIGNGFTVAGALALKAGGQEVDSRRLARPAISTALPGLPGTPPRFAGSVIEVRTGATAAEIQDAIDAAARQRGPVAIHLPTGAYAIGASLTVPANREIHIVGDGMPYRTVLTWTGPGTGPMISLAGPSRMRLSDLTLVGGDKADGLVVERCDQAGGQVWMDQTQSVSARQCGYLIEGVKQARAVLRDGGHADCQVGVRVDGGALTILSGASSSNHLSYELANGARLVARDIWYETGDRPRFIRLTGAGDFTLSGSNIATPRKAGEIPVEIDGFAGRAAFLGVVFTETSAPSGLPAVVASGSQPGMRLLLLGCHGSGEYFADRSTAGHVARAESQQYADGGGAKPIADVGAVDAGFLREMLAALRQPVATLPTPVPAGATDVRLNRVYLRATRTGIHLKGGA
ncbi:hypothetical protein BH11PSE2_BH11PSE2_10470 [soil metagenome]